MSMNETGAEWLKFWGFLALVVIVGTLIGVWAHGA